MRRAPCHIEMGIALILVLGVIIFPGVERRVASVSPPQNHPEGAPGPSPLGTGETPNLNWQEETHGPAGSIPTNAQGLRAYSAHSTEARNAGGIR